MFCMRGTAFTSIEQPDRTTWMLVGSGILALAIAMGIGRFAFTPLLPLMLRDGTLSATTGAEWAAANYGGYLAGALTASWFSGDPQRGLRLALAGVALTTLAIAWLGEATMDLGGTLLRAASGVFSAWALVCTSSWCLAELARRQAPRLGAWIYTGVGVGIAVAGALAWLGGRQPARSLWLELGLVAVAGAVLIGLGRRASPAPVATAVAAAAGSAPRALTRAHLGLVMCYGILGFGYIVPATFLPAMAREVVANPLVFGLTWPLFGLAAALSVAAAARWLPEWPRRHVWAWAHAAMAIGTALPLATQALWSLAASAVLVGGTFMVATMAGLQLAREQAPANPTPLLARMTAAFATGQIAGPLLIRALGSHRWAGLDALALAHAAATALLCLTAAWLWRPTRSAIPSTVKQLR
jgi:hypothetical protein